MHNDCISYILIVINQLVDDFKPRVFQDNIAWWTFRQPKAWARSLMWLLYQGVVDVWGCLRKYPRVPSLLGYITKFGFHEANLHSQFIIYNIWYQWTTLLLHTSGGTFWTRCWKFGFKFSTSLQKIFTHSPTYSLSHSLNMSSRLF